MPTDLSGVAGDLRRVVVERRKMRFEEANEAGRHLWPQLKVIVEDQGYQVPKAVQAAKLINRDKVFASSAARHAK